MNSGVILTALLSCAALLTAQTNRGEINGTVFDPSGAVVPGAAVTIKNLGTNQLLKTATSNTGTYAFPSLEPVVYSVSVQFAGFRTETIQNVKVDTASAATVNVTLHAGDVSTEVTVTADAAQVNTESGTTSSTVTQRQITDVPLFNRSVLDLAVTQPNVMGEAGSEDPSISAVATAPGFNLSVNGGRPGSTNFLADGANNTGVSIARTMVSFSPETVQEFTVQTSAYSAEYGQAGGGIINATTKSGTNSLTGTALWYNRNPYFAAAPWTNATANRPVPTLKYNQFSLAAGGPVVIPKLYNGRNKTFWFAAYEPRYRRDTLAQDAILPTDAMRQGDFSNTVVVNGNTVPADVAKRFGQASTGDATIYMQYNLAGNQLTPATPVNGQYQPFPGNVIPKSWMDAVAVKSLPYIATAKDWYIGQDGKIYNFYNPRTLIQDDKRYTLRIDQTISDRNRLYGRYTTTPTIKIQGTPCCPTGDGAEYTWARQAMLSDTHTFSPTLLNEIRLNYTRGRFSGTVAPQWDVKTGENLNTTLGLPSFTKGGVPYFMNNYIGGQGSTQADNIEERYGIGDTFYINRGNKSWKIGVDLAHALQNVTPLYGAIGGVYDIRALQTNSSGATTGTGGNNFATFLIGVPNQVTMRPAIIPYYYRWESAAAFVQNDWKVKPGFTLNLGLRYSLNLPRTEKYDHQGVFMPELAKQFPLAAPLTLANGKTVTSVLVPPFAFVGKGGRSRYMTPADYTDFEPRFGFAWVPGFLAQKQMVLRGGYGISHAPLSGANRLPAPDYGATQTYGGSTNAQNPNYVMRLGENPPVINAISPDQAIFGAGGVPSDGLIYQNSLSYNGIAYAVSPNSKTPYSQNWNLTVSWRANPNTTLEVAYVGNKGTHLFVGSQNINPKDISLINALNASNVNSGGNIADPFGRLGANGRVLNVQAGSLGSPYLGFSTLYKSYDASGNSIRHATYASVVHRTNHLMLTSNYTFGKSIDDAVGTPEKGVATSGNIAGQIAFGGTRLNDRSVSAFDQKHTWNTTFIYDLPFGRGRKLMSNSWAPLRGAAGGWTVSGISRFTSGFPFSPTLVDGNLLGDLTHTIRPDILPGVPLLNPLYDPKGCPVGALCQPYLNPLAFARPLPGELGTAPRTLDGARGPWMRFFDASIQKNFPLGRNERRKIQLRMDLLNAFNHPIFRTAANQVFSDFMSAPSTATLTAADYNTWATANGQPQSTTPAGAAQLSQINAMVATQRNSTGALPNDFFRVPLPANFWAKAAASYDITNLQGYKMFRMRQAYSAGFGDLYQGGVARYIQLGLKIFF